MQIVIFTYHRERVAVEVVDNSRAAKEAVLARYPGCDNVMVIEVNRIEYAGREHGQVMA